MSFKMSKSAWAVALAIGLLSACGPVKFSASSTGGDVDETGVTPTPTPSPSPTPPIINPPGTLRNVSYSSTVPYKDYKLDIVLVVDDSNSMLPDNQKLGARLSNFVAKLESSNIDWQMCATVTRDVLVSPGKKAWGASIFWQKYAINPHDKNSVPNLDIGMVLRKGTPNLENIFKHTINFISAGWEGSDDERGIKAAYHHVDNGNLRLENNGCYRENSAVSFILISDEDERSVGGDASQVYFQAERANLTLEKEDKPEEFVRYFKSIFGADRRFTWNSIIVKPGDSECMKSQDASALKSHYGFRYAELSGLTGGGVGSICDSDYSKTLDIFFGQIQNSLSSLPLECVPYRGNIGVNINPNTGSITSKVEGQSLVFSSPVPSGSTVSLSYQCEESRGPSSVEGAATPLANEGFFARIFSFFKNLFF